MPPSDDTVADQSEPLDTAARAGSARSAEALSLDTVLEVLSNRHRRYALYALQMAEDEVLPLEALFEEVTALSAAVDEAAFTRGRYVEIANDLYQWHLPVLADVGVIDCDARHRTVRYLGAPTLDDWIRRVRHAELTSE